MMLILFGLTACIFKRIANTEHSMDCGMVHHHHRLRLLVLFEGYGEKTPLKGLCHTHIRIHTHMHTHVIIHLLHFVYQCITSRMCLAFLNFWIYRERVGSTKANRRKHKQACEQVKKQASKQANIVAADTAAVGVECAIIQI